jgi:hypothetical protein
VAAVNLSGKVLDSLGRPFPEVALLFECEDPRIHRFYGPEQTRTDSTGSYSIQLAAATWKLFLFVRGAEDSHVAWHRQYSVTLAPENPVVDFRIESYRVEGRVIGPTGAVLDSAYVSASATTVFEGASDRARAGKFSLLLPPGEYDFYANSNEPDRGNPIRILRGVPVRADTSFDIVLAGDPVTGLVRGPGGMPLFRVLVVAEGDLQFSKARTGSDGRYGMYLPPGDYTLSCSPDPTEAHILTRVYPPRRIAGASVIDFDLSGAEWSGSVRSSATLQPIEGVLVKASLFADLFGRSAIATTDAAGVFRLVLERQREYELSFAGDDVKAATYPGIFAAADSTFDVLLDPLPTP